jgi:cysteine dioxygenase
MSAELAELGVLAAHDASRERITGGLSALVESLSQLGRVPTLDEVNDLLFDADITESEIQPFRQFKPSTYARHRLMRNQYAELLVLCWRPGQRTPIHDHNGSHGAVRVHEGVMWESTFEVNDDRRLCYRSARECACGAVTGAGVTDIHQLGNPEVSGQDLVTLHIYAPPLNVLNTYKVGSADVGSYCPDHYTDGAGI